MGHIRDIFDIVILSLLVSRRRGSDYPEIRHRERGIAIPWDAIFDPHEIYLGRGWVGEPLPQLVKTIVMAIQSLSNFINTL